MPGIIREKVRNNLWQRLDAPSFAALAPHLSPVALPKRQALSDAFKPLTRVYFIEAGIAWVVAVTPSGSRAEVGMIGREGLVGVGAVLGERSSSFDMFMQADGGALAMSARTLSQLAGERAPLRRLILDFVQVMLIQISHTAVASLSLRRRLARWLLMSHDPVDGDDVPMTHEFLSVMLTVRRPGITEAVQGLEATGAIQAKRGVITVRDRDLLRELAGGDYGAPEAEYQRLAAT